MFPEKELHGHSPKFHIHVFVSDLYCIFPRSICLFCCRKIYGPILGIYCINRSHTNECGNWDGTEAAQFPEKEYINEIFVAVCYKFFILTLLLSFRKLILLPLMFACLSTSLFYLSYLYPDHHSAFPDLLCASSTALLSLVSLVGRWWVQKSHLLSVSCKKYHNAQVLWNLAHIVQSTTLGAILSSYCTFEH
jgi:hypothetical protein